MQKPLRLSSFTIYLLALGFLLSALSCHFNPNMQTPGQGYLQGEWQQDSVAGQKQLISYSLYHLRFSCDSFFMAIHSYSKVNSDGDSCTSRGHWAEYCKGTYTQKHDTLHMRGLFCNADMTIKYDKDCLRTGDYEEFFKTSKQTDSLIRFSSTTNVTPINAHLIKRTSCIPKPL
jgi:hypothetical protein